MAQKERVMPTHIVAVAGLKHSKISGDIMV